jgi:Transposase DDE domain/Serpin (serine protease inhibitor)
MTIEFGSIKAPIIGNRKGSGMLWGCNQSPLCSLRRCCVWLSFNHLPRRLSPDSHCSKNRDRLLTSDVAQQFFAEVNKHARRFMSDEHFTVDGTLIQAWASQKSFRSKDGSDDGDGANFHGQKRSNETHESTTDADARLYKKSYGKESKLSYLGHALVENRNGLIAAAMVTHADGYAERDAALLMLAEKQEGRSRRITVGADKAYDTKDFVGTVRELNVTPHVTKNDKGRTSNLDRRTTRQPGYAISLSRRWLIEKGFGWLKQTGPLRQVNEFLGLISAPDAFTVDLDRPFVFLVRENATGALLFAGALMNPSASK